MANGRHFPNGMNLSVIETIRRSQATLTRNGNKIAYRVATSNLSIAMESDVFNCNHHGKIHRFVHLVCYSFVDFELSLLQLVISNVGVCWLNRSFNMRVISLHAIHKWIAKNIQRLNCYLTVFRCQWFRKCIALSCRTTWLMPCHLAFDAGKNIYNRTFSHCVLYFDRFNFRIEIYSFCVFLISFSSLPLWVVRRWDSFCERT